MAQTTQAGTSPVTAGRGYNERLSNTIPAALASSYIRFQIPEARTHPGIVPTNRGEVHSAQEYALGAIVTRGDVPSVKPDDDTIDGGG